MSSKKIFFVCVCIKWLILALKHGSTQKFLLIKIHDNVNKTLTLISDIAKRWGGKNICDLIDKEIKGKYEVKSMNELTEPQIRKSKIDRARLFKGGEHFMYVHEDIAITIIMQSRLSGQKINQI